MRLERFHLHPNVVAAFSGTAEGNQAAHTGAPEVQVSQARASLASGAGVAPSRLRFMHQVHSAVLAPIAAKDEPAPVADALLDASGRFAPTVLTADCLPVLWAASSAEGTLLAASHAGRNGLLDGVLQETHRGLLERGAHAIEALIGPAVCVACYEVPQEMAEHSEARMPGIGSQTSWGTPSLDLPGAAARFLEDLGVSVRNLACCTLEDANYFSYRRGDTVGRNASVCFDATLPSTDGSGLA